MSESQQLQSLASNHIRKAGIIPIDGFVGTNAVCLIALDDLGTPIEHGDVRELGDFLNRYIASAGRSRTECGGDLMEKSIGHVHAPVSWHLENFARYVRENQIGQAELEMMFDVAMAVRHIVVELDRREGDRRAGEV